MKYPDDFPPIVREAKKDRISGITHVTYRYGHIDPPEAGVYTTRPEYHDLGLARMTEIMRDEWWNGPKKGAWLK